VTIATSPTSRSRRRSTKRDSDATHQLELAPPPPKEPPPPSKELVVDEENDEDVSELKVVVELEKVDALDVLAVDPEEE
jgi:hypothetical protein